MVAQIKSNSIWVRRGTLFVGQFFLSRYDSFELLKKRPTEYQYPHEESDEILTRMLEW